MTRQQEERARIAGHYTRAAGVLTSLAMKMSTHLAVRDQAAALSASAASMRTLAVECKHNKVSAVRLHQTRLDTLMVLLACNGHGPSVDKITQSVRLCIASLRRHVTGPTAADLPTVPATAPRQRRAQATSA